MTPNCHVNLAKWVVPKRYHLDYDDGQAAELFDALVDEVKNIEVTV